MKSLNDLYLDICEAIASNAALDTWSNTYYGQGHTVYMGWDVENLPQQSDCPVIGVVPFMQRRGRDTARVSYGFSFFTCIYDDTLVTGAYTNLQEFTGVRRSEEMRKLVQDAVVAVDMGNALIGPVESAYEPVEDFPLFEVFFDMTISDDITLGTDPLA